jgi:pyruvate dehydrogenase E1 component alpha subunit
MTDATSNPSPNPTIALIDDDLRADTATRLAMFREALRVRVVEEEIVARYGEQEMRCPTHICIGQEAPPVGVSAHLRPEDHAFSAHRSHGHYLAKGGDLGAMIAELYGRATGCAAGKGGSQHLIDMEAGFLGSAPILASTISVGVGAAWAARRRGEDRVVVIYFGDGATEEGAFHEAMNFAGVNRLPVVFVCENNLYSVHSALDIRQPEHRTVKDVGPVHGVEALSGDGNDIDVAWRLGKYAVERARSGANPVLLEFFTYRWKEHCGPLEDGHLGYRSEQEIAEWQERCPVAGYERRLSEEQLVSSAMIVQMRAEIAQEVAQAFAFAIESPYPEMSELDRFIYPNSGGRG